MYLLECFFGNFFGVSHGDCCVFRVLVASSRQFDEKVDFLFSSFGFQYNSIFFWNFVVCQWCRWMLIHYCCFFYSCQLQKLQILLLLLSYQLFLLCLVGGKQSPHPYYYHNCQLHLLPHHLRPLPHLALLLQYRSDAQRQHQWCMHGTHHDRHHFYVDLGIT